MSKRYYEFEDDLKAYPDAWCYVVYSPRGKGKTYSALRYSYHNNIPICYMKRTNDDVKFICRPVEDEYDTSPYAPLNRDEDINVYGKLIDNGVGGYWHYEEGEPQGLPVAYCLSLNAIKRVKGFDASRCDWMLLDEFIPQIGERINRREGELLLDCYETIARDREKRGRKPLKLILFANSEEISTPITNTLEIVDAMADLSASDDSHLYLEDRGIMIHHITNNDYPMEESEKQGIYKAMANTSWGKKSFEGDFANNDFSSVKPQSLKGYSGYLHLIYKDKHYYIYRNYNGNYYMCKSPAPCLKTYNLDRENEQKAFYYNEQIDLWNVCIEDKFKFQKYSMYDLIVNYTKLFNVRR